AGRLVDERPVGPEGLDAERGKTVRELAVGGIGLGVDIGKQSGGHHSFERAAGNIGMAVFAGDHLALFGDAHAVRNGAGGKRAGRLEARAAAATDRAAAAVKEAQGEATRFGELDQPENGGAYLAVRG